MRNRPDFVRGGRRRAFALLFVAMVLFFLLGFFVSEPMPKNEPPDVASIRRICASVSWADMTRAARLLRVAWTRRRIFLRSGEMMTTRAGMGHPVIPSAVTV